MGSFAIQIAKLYNAEVTAVDSDEKQEFITELGADYVIDYTKEDFTQNGKLYDLILDLRASHSISEYAQALSDNGADIR